MNANATTQDFDHYLPQRNSLLIRGLLLALTGVFLTIFSVFEPDVQIMSQSSSWLPLVALVILATGIMAGLDAFISRHSKEFFSNLQMATLDSVVGIFLLVELDKTAEKVILLAAAYLLVKGIFRVFAAITVNFPHATSATVGGIVSVIFGILLWQEWPSSSMWFICFCLSADIMMRGWALTHFGVWLRALHRSRNQAL
ncbi:MAG: hypothetical protein CVV13_07100 [Gammaproteobacteria bacterium HGW-Gammaproteobacteria-3]|nr:MAG: hypothetical protein CVV13_07100 [Gammaproteobacteria bacterium HGW-Gammaproteobacteria-3]